MVDSPRGGCFFVLLPALKRLTNVVVCGPYPRTWYSIFSRVSPLFYRAFRGVGLSESGGGYYDCSKGPPRFGIVRGDTALVISRFPPL